MPSSPLALSLPAISSPVTGFDVLVLALLLHVWVVVSGLAFWQDNAQTGLNWIDRRVHMQPRLYAVLMFAAVVTVWLPFAIGGYPTGQELPGRRAGTRQT